MSAYLLIDQMIETLILDLFALIGFIATMFYLITWAVKVIDEWEEKREKRGITPNE